ncbi:MAG: hypothetical protein A2X86_16790 [Bdellovibrionales bacterium GWA2_49_15]|nr:MAG: hypothetical protein A2X86_16790 [Bdellovibrionales bacterium GWA2_49_15]
MPLTDQGHPIIYYPKGKSPREWGQIHGESVRSGIQELAQIRRELMLKKNPALLPELQGLAQEQWEVTKRFAPDLALELEGLTRGANLTLTDIVILNNYTDFRDIIPEQGCSTVAFKRRGQMIAGQTWDMHRTAKNYICTLVIPETAVSPGQIVFSLVGCLGLMGVGQHGLFIGVNNINTRGARAGVMWPALVRRSLQCPNFEQMSDIVTTAPVTSGHNYLLADTQTAQHWEITPDVKEMVSGISTDQSDGTIFHTNHCLSPKTKRLEDESSLSSTTFSRWDLLQTHLSKAETSSGLYGILTSHENHPKGICSHFESGLQDPSFTCGGGVYDFRSKIFTVWRGCPIHDENYVHYDFDMSTLALLKTIKR